MTAVRLRIQRIRRIVTACAVAVFIALFSTIYVQMASGNDPELGTTSASTSTTPSSSTSTSTSTSTSASTNTSTSPSTTADEPAAVTTGQS